MYSLDLFNWHKETGILSAEASTLRVMRPNHEIEIRSHVTKKVERFVLADVIYWGSGEDREIRGWKYRPLNRACKVRSVVIEND